VGELSPILEAKALGDRGATQDAPKWDKFVPLFDDALLWNQALESLFVGRFCPTLDLSAESRNCSQSNYPARGTDDDSEGGREPAQGHENKGRRLFVGRGDRRLRAIRKLCNLLRI
jgi:hypothetical protein